LIAALYVNEATKVYYHGCRQPLSYNAFIQQQFIFVGVG